MHLVLGRCAAASLLIRVLLLVIAAVGLPTIATAQVSDPVIARAMQGPPQVDPQLLNQLQSADSTRMLVFLRERPALPRAGSMPWQARGARVVDALQETARRSQGRVLALLRSRGVEHQAFWVDNVIVVPQANAQLIDALRALDEVALLAASPEILLFKPESAETQPGLAAVESNLTRIKAPDAWALGFTGSGITVASIDTGVRHTHQLLAGSYRGNTGGGFNHAYNWRNPYDLSMTVPADSDNHGSHVTGTMTGDDGATNQTGVAPGAEWIACRGFNPSATDAGLLACAQFMLAPTDLADQNPDPSRRPHVVNNSWGDCGRAYNGWFQGVIDSWHAAGIYPVFANGNASNCSYSSPPGLNTVGNPGRYGNVTGVGSTGQSNGTYANHSNWGPTDNADTVNGATGHANLKPQVVAPGVAIRSATRASDTSYGSFTGTSMSAPHVSGLVALIWQAGPCLVGNYALTELVLETSANAVPYASNHGTEGPGNVPNHATGWGEIDALAAVTLAQALCTDVGMLSGTVTAAGSGQPLAGATVQILGNGLPTLKATTNAAGTWSRAMPAGLYSIQISLHGYVTAQFDATVVASDSTQADAQLQQRPLSAISGVVRDGGGQGWPLYARIDIAGHPGSPIFTDPTTGAYSATLLEGETYDFTVTSVSAGWLPQQRSVTPPAGGATEDFQLALDQVNCSAPGYAIDYVYLENFDGGNGGFTVTGPSSWVHGAPTNGPAAAVSAPNVWATSLAGNYGPNENGYLTSPAIDLSAHAGKTPILQWRQWLRTESGFDFASVEVSNDGGTSWNRVFGELSGDVNLAWTLRSVPLDPSYAVSNFRVRFRLRSDSSVHREGWYIDNVAIGISDFVPGAVQLSESFESTTFPPTGWIRLNVDGGGTQWERSTARAADGTASARHNFSNVGQQDGWLVTPAIVIAAGSELVFSEYTAFPTFYGKHSLWVCASSCDAPPTNYTQLRELGAPVAQWRVVTQSLASFAGQSVRLAFRYEGNDAAAWHIDAVRVVGPSSGSPTLACNVVSGGMLTGFVTDLNTASALVGATVAASGSNARATTVATATDPGLADGFYQMFVPATGPTELTASFARYADSSETVAIASASIARQDFALGAGWLELAPGTVSVRIPAEHSGSVTVELSNVGSAASDFAMVEYAGHGTVASATGLQQQPSFEDPPKQAVDTGLVTLNAMSSGRPAGLSLGMPGSVLPNAWTSVPAMPLPVARTAAAVVNGKLHVAGGQSTGGIVLGALQVYDPQTGLWDATLPAMPQPKDNACAAVIDGRVYVPGGTTAGGGVLATVVVFDPATNSWSTDATDPLPAPRFGQACAGFGGKLYLFGGTLDQTTLSNTALVYDPAAADGTRWSSLPNMPLATLLGAAVAADGKIFHAAFRITGNTNPATVIAFDPATNSWISYPNLQVGRGEGAMWAEGDRLFIGSGGVGTFLRSIEAYDLATGTTGSWSIVSQVSEGRQAPGYAIDAGTGTLYLVGGFDGSFKASGEQARLLIDLPWLSESPATGTVADQDSAAIALGFDASGLAAGTYRATLSASNDGPYAAPTMAVTMEVVAGPPVVDAVAPASGLITGGQTVTLSGSNYFPAYAGDTTVTLGGVACTGVVVVDSDTITCTAPAQASGSVDVTVTNPGGLSGTLVNGYTYIELAPQLVSVAPAQGPFTGGTAVTLTGAHFLASGTTGVTFGTAACANVVVVNASTITCTTPAHAAGTVDVTVTNPGGQSVVLDDGYTYLDAAPSLVAVLPAQGFTQGGLTVTVQGSAFQSAGTTVVRFGTEACTAVVVVNAETITCTTPAQAAGTVDVSVTNPDGQTGVLVDGFTYVVAPDRVFRDGFE
jgi:subtilisin family serine protease